MQDPASAVPQAVLQADDEVDHMCNAVVKRWWLETSGHMTAKVVQRSGETVSGHAHDGWRAGLHADTYAQISFHTHMHERMSLSL